MVVLDQHECRDQDANPRVLNPFNVVLETKSYLEYLIFQGNIIVCSFPALDTLHTKGFATKHKDRKKLDAALFDSSISYARLTVSSPDKLVFKIPLTSIYSDPRVRYDILWLCEKLENSMDLNIYAEFLKTDNRVVKVQVASTAFLRIAINANT